MARKKKIINETIIETPSIETAPQEEEIIIEEPVEVKEVEIPKTTYKFNLHDRIKTTKKGKETPSGTGKDKDIGIGRRYVGNIVQGAPYPYAATNANGFILGYWKEEDLEVA